MNEGLFVRNAKSTRGLQIPAGIPLRAHSMLPYICLSSFERTESPLPPEVPDDNPTENSPGYSSSFPWRSCWILNWTRSSRHNPAVLISSKWDIISALLILGTEEKSESGFRMRR